MITTNIKKYSLMCSSFGEPAENIFFKSFHSEILGLKYMNF